MIDPINGIIAILGKLSSWKISLSVDVVFLSRSNTVGFGAFARAILHKCEFSNRNDGGSDLRSPLRASIVVTIWTCVLVLADPIEDVVNADEFATIVDNVVVKVNPVFEPDPRSGTVVSGVGSGFCLYGSLVLSVKTSPRLSFKASTISDTAISNSRSTC